MSRELWFIRILIFSTVPSPSGTINEAALTPARWLNNRALPSIRFPASFTSISSKHEKLLLQYLDIWSKAPDGTPFRRPVRELWPEIGQDYEKKTESPVDLLNIAYNVYGQLYPNLGDIKQDFDLLYNNSVSYNGLQHPLSRLAYRLRRTVFAFIDRLQEEQLLEKGGGPGVKFTRSRKSGITQSTEAEPETDKSEELRNDLEKLICLCERYHFDTLAAMCIDRLISLYKATDVYPSSASIAYIYAHSVSTSKLRLYLARTLAYVIVSEKGVVADGTTEWIWEVMKQNEELGLQVLAEFRGKNGVLVQEAEDAPACDYHWHGEDEECPLAEQ